MMWHSCLLILFLIFLCISSGAPSLTKEGVQETQKMMKNICKRRFNVKQELLNQLKEGVFVEDSKLKCYIHCCLGMMRTMKKDKITVPEAVKQVEALLPGDMRKPALRQLHLCKNVGGTDDCDIAFNFAKCGHEVEPLNNLIPT